jgi:tetratricopeptide (TPR) repeat protein
MSGNRRRRYQSVSEFQQDINLYLEGHGVSAREDSLLESLTKLVRRNKAVSIATSVALIIILLLSVLFVRGLRAERDIARTALDSAKVADAARLANALEASRDMALQAVRSADRGFTLEAKIRAESADKLASNSPWGSYALGYLEWKSSNLDRALTHLNQALAKDSNHEPSRLALAKVQALKGDLTQIAALVKDVTQIKD